MPGAEVTKRIQRQRHKGWRMPEGTVYVGRPSRWGNPFLVQRRIRHGVEGWIVWPHLTLAPMRYPTERAAATEAVRLFEQEAQRPVWKERIAALRGKDLACWCAVSMPCHADVLLRLAAGLGPRKSSSDHENATRTVPCPSCDAKPGKRCDIGEWAHTLRYVLAAEQGLVPPLPFDRVASRG